MDRTLLLLLVTILAIPACRSSRSASPSAGAVVQRTHSETAHAQPVIDAAQVPSSVLRVNDELITIEDVLDPLKPGLRAAGLVF